MWVSNRLEQNLTKVTEAPGAPPSTCLDVQRGLEAVTAAAT